MTKNPWFQNVGSEFLALAIILALGWLVYQLKSRGPLLSFFGIRTSKKLFVYLSHLRIRPGGAIGIDDQPRSFGSSAIPAYESALMPALQRLFNYVIPGMEGLPGFLKRILLSDIDVDALPSPLDVSEIEGDSTFVAVGSPGYNLASSYIEDSLHSIGSFTDDMSAITLPGASPLSGDHYAFVQLAGNANQTAFYVAGITSREYTRSCALSCHSLAISKQEISEWQAILRDATDHQRRWIEVSSRLRMRLDHAASPIIAGPARRWTTLECEMYMSVPQGA